MGVFRYRCRPAWVWYQLAKRISWLRRYYPYFKVVEAAVAQNGLDTHQLDEAIKNAASTFVPGEIPRPALNGRRVAILTSALHDYAGGHTKLVLNKLKMLEDDYDCGVFMTDIDEAWREAPKAMSQFKSVNGLTIDLPTHAKRLKKVFDMICAFGPGVVLVYMHNLDIYGAGVLALLKKYTGIKVIYASHASHYPNYGISFADLISTSLPSTVYINAYFRKMDVSCQALGMLSFDNIEKYQTYSEEDILRKRKELGLTATDKCTMSGGYGYKFFDSDGHSEYFQMIKKMLERNADVKHIMLTNLTPAQSEVVEHIFTDSALRKRLIIKPQSTDYLLAFKCADVFVDSFPVSGAMTMVDLMRIRVPAVVKINRENALWSFHEYQRPDYEYMYETAEGVLRGIEVLLRDQGAANDAVEKNFRWFMSTYEGRAAKRCLLNMVQNIDRPESLITAPPPKNAYKFVFPAAGR